MKFMFIGSRRYLLTVQQQISELGLPQVLTAPCHTVEEALEFVQRHEPDVIFLQHSLSPEGNEGLEIAAKVKHLTIYLITATPDIMDKYKAHGIKHVKYVLSTDMEGIASVLKGESK